MRYTDDHEWIEADGDAFTIGITDHAQEALGDIVFVELPDVGASFSKGDVMATVESVKAASDIYSPAGGEIIEVNNALLDDLTAITPESAMANWLFKIKINDAGDLESLMDEAAYNAMIG